MHCILDPNQVGFSEDGTHVQSTVGEIEEENAQVCPPLLHVSTFLLVALFHCNIYYLLYLWSVFLFKKKLLLKLGFLPNS